MDDQDSQTEDGDQYYDTLLDNLQDAELISKPGKNRDVELDDPTEEPTETTGVDEIM